MAHYNDSCKSGPFSEDAASCTSISALLRQGSGLSSLSLEWRPVKPITLTWRTLVRIVAMIRVVHALEQRAPSFKAREWINVIARPVREGTHAKDSSPLYWREEEQQHGLP